MLETITNLLEKSVAKFGSNDMMWEKENGVYKSTSYSEMRAEVHEIATGLLANGIQKGDMIALLSQGRKDWITCELGMLYAGATNVPLSIKLEEADLKMRLVHSGAKMLIVSALQLPKVKNILASVPNLEKIVLIDRQESYSAEEIFLGDLKAMGAKAIADGTVNLAEVMAAIVEDDPALISYTSGTSADPKGIILSHKNLVCNAYQSFDMFPLEETDRMLLILPLDHSFAHTTGMYTFMIGGASLASVEFGSSANETLKNIPKNIKEIKPTLLLSVPAFAKNFRKNIEKGIREKGAKTEKIFRHALDVAYKYHGDGFNRGKGFRVLYKPLYLLYDKILFSKIRHNFGGKLNYFVGGGAVLDVELQRFFFAIGIPMYQGYGLSEASPVISSNTIPKHKMGSSGVIAPRMDLKICSEDGIELPQGEKGEIVVRGGNVMLGYFKNEEATQDALRDGWLHSGDMGYMDKDGFLYVLGRFKSLLIGSDGEKYSPEGIETSLEDNSKYIDQAMLHNNQNNYTTALIVLNKPAVNAYLSGKGIDAKSDEGKDAVLELIQREIAEYRPGGTMSDLFPHRWLPASFSILGDAFTEDNKFLNSTMKMVRGKITEHYKSRIDLMYTAEGKNVQNRENYASIETFLC